MGPAGPAVSSNLRPSGLWHDSSKDIKHALCLVSVHTLISEERRRCVLPTTRTWAFGLDDDEALFKPSEE